MSETRKMSAVALLPGLPDDGYVPVVDSSGTVRRVSVAALKSGVRDSIRVGGRNLLRSGFLNKSGNCTTKGGSLTMNSSADTYFSMRVEDITDDDMGREFTLSVDCSGMKDGDTWVMAGKQGVNMFDMALSNGRCSVTFLMREEGLSNNRRTFHFDDRGRSFPNGLSAVTLSNFKLERGNMATDWTPAPEDYMPTNSISGG